MNIPPLVDQGCCQLGTISEIALVKSAGATLQTIPSHPAGALGVYYRMRTFQESPVTFASGWNPVFHVDYGGGNPWTIDLAWKIAPTANGLEEALASPNGAHGMWIFDKARWGGMVTPLEATNTVVSLPAISTPGNGCWVAGAAFTRVNAGDLGPLLPSGMTLRANQMQNPNSYLLFDSDGPSDGSPAVSYDTAVALVKSIGIVFYVEPVRE